MSEREALIELLTEPDNISATLDVANAITEVKQHLRMRFWNEAERQIRLGLESFASGRLWLVEDHETVARRSGENWRGVQVVARPEDERPRLLVGVWQENYRLFRGIAFDRAQALPHPLKEVRNLQDRISQMLPRSDAEHLGWQGTEIELNPDEVLIELASDPSSLALAAVEPVLSILGTHADWIVEADEALGRFIDSNSKFDSAAL